VFTGLIECTGTLVAVRSSGNSAVIELSAPLPESEISVGDSIAVNGACLTVTTFNGGRFFFDASPETISRTSFGSMKSGALLNLERALKMGDRLDGHIVTGHVDATGSLKSRRQSGNSTLLAFSLHPDHCRLLVDKGSVAVDGISLTVAEVAEDSFSVVIIPHTLSKTTLATLSIGSSVNIETDIIGKYIARLSSPHGKKGGLTIEKLAQNGFM